MPGRRWSQTGHELMAMDESGTRLVRRDDVLVAIIVGAGHRTGGRVRTGVARASAAEEVDHLRRPPCENRS